MNLNGDFSTYRSRYMNYSMVKLLIVMMSLFALGFILLGIFLKMYYLFIISLLFILTIIPNFLIYKLRARFYLYSFFANKEELKLTFYDKDTMLNKLIRWNELDFHFGSVKGDAYLVLWDKNIEILKIYKTMADHSGKFEELKNIFNQHIPKERIMKNIKIFRSNLYYTKPYRIPLIH